MSKIFLSSLLALPAVGAALVLSSSAIAAEASVSNSGDAISASATDLLTATDVTPSEGVGVATANTSIQVATAPNSAVVQPLVTPVEFPIAEATQTPKQQASSELTAPAKIPQLTADASNSLSQISQYGAEGTESVGQVTSVSQLSDVQPTDWAFQALQSLVERYGCIAGYPDGTYRGNRPMTRYEFAAGLNACLDRVNELIASATADLVRKEDLEALRKLQEEFAAELATLRGRVDALEARTATLEAQQFSTTTKLQGEAIFALSQEFNNDNQAVFQNRVRLALNSSFTGKDLLVTRLASGNFDFFQNGDDDAPLNGSGRQTFQLNSGNDVVLDWLAYYFPVGKNLNVYVAAVNGLHVDYVATTANPYLEDFGGGSGALSFFGQSNSIYNIGGGSGVGLSYKIGNAFAINLGYLAGGADSPASPLESNGLFNGSYAALAQVSFQPLKGRLKLAATYVNSYHTPGTPIFSYGGGFPGVVGTDLANNALGVPVVGNSGGLSASFQILPKLVLSAWGTYTDANFKDSAAPNGEIWSYAAAVAVPDLFGKGNLAGLVVGVPPYLANAGSVAGDDNKTPLHVEGFYKWQLNNFISITPGVIYLSNPQQGNGDEDAIIGTIRTTFKF